MKIGDELDPLLWAKKPKSQQALDLLAAAAKEGDTTIVGILSGHVRDGVADDKGKLLSRWDGLRWVSMAADMERDRYAV